MMLCHSVAAAVLMTEPFEPQTYDEAKASTSWTQAADTLKSKYQRVVGLLMYAILGTRPDIAYAVSVVSRISANPTIDH
jgi:hypothetical protein